MAISIDNTRIRRESGYSLLMVVFMVATILLVAATAVPNILTQGRREREAETIWRGEQYERAIGLYFRKFGRYPTKIEDLTRQTNGVRFLRQAYTDPMNREDGSWRFIYVGPNGQLIGSVRNVSLLQGLLSSQGMPFGASLGAGAQPPPPAAPNATSNGAPGAQQTPGATTANPSESQPSPAGGPQPLGGSVIGGNIIGVGSKVKSPSLRVYKNGDTYEEWEFVFNPLQQGATPGQPVPANPAANPLAPQFPPEGAAPRN